MGDHNHLQNGGQANDFKLPPPPRIPRYRSGTDVNDIMKPFKDEEEGANAYTITPRPYDDSTEISQMTLASPASDYQIPQLVVDKPDDADPSRAGWDNKVQFLFSVISYAVGLGNIWRFPYLCQQNGGGAFLIPYCIMMVLEGMPLFLIEMGIGQRLRTGPIGVWNSIHPYLGGIGVSSAVVSFFVALYYNVIITWCLFYLGNCFQNPLPWRHCPSSPNESRIECENENSSETMYFWYREAIDTTDSIENFGGINWKMMLCLFAAWFIVWVCMCKGIKSSGKVMYVTGSFPYLVTLIFFVRSVMLPGAGRGVAYMITPQIHRLLDPRVWLDAATQIFYSMGLAFGGLIAFSSYSPIKNNVKRDVIVLSAANLITSLWSAVVIYCILGYKGHLNYEKCLKLHNNSETLCDFNEILKGSAEGTGLAFIVFAQAMLKFPGSQFWAVMFFLMLLMLGLGSMFGTLEGVVTSIYDLKLVTWLSKPVLTAIICSTSCLVGLIFVTRAGEYWVKLFDTFAGSYALMAAAFCEVIAISYVYGWKRFCRDIEYMTGSYPGLYWQITWRFIAPIIMGILFISSLVLSLKDPPKYFAYHSDIGQAVETAYPAWTFIIAAIIVVSAMIPVPFVVFVRYFKIWKVEGDIPTAAKYLNSTVSTTRMLNSQQSFGNLDSVNNISPRQTEVTYEPRNAGNLLSPATIA